MDNELMYECFFNNSNSINKQSKDNKYVKITYISEPIGKEKIRLQLTTFDIEAFEKDKNLTEIPLKTVEQTITLHPGITDDQTYLYYIQNELNSRVDKFYKEEIKNLKKLLENRKANIGNKKIIKGNITNSDNIICEVIEGNVVNCDNIHCKEIKGNAINCDIEYQK